MNKSPRYLNVGTDSSALPLMVIIYSKRVSHPVLLTRDQEKFAIGRVERHVIEINPVLYCIGICLQVNTV